MKKQITFEPSMIAPCGINCGSCIANIRDRNRCDGCISPGASKRNYCNSCRIRNCELLKNASSGFCYECEKFPCQRMKQLDKRYRTRYHTSLIDNLFIIKEQGIESLLEIESQRRTCPDCGGIVSIHKEHCLACNA